MRTFDSRRQGFTLVELLIVVAIIGIIGTLMIPNFLDALQKTKQKRTMADMHMVGTAMMAWLTDQVGAAAAGSIGGGTTFDLASYPEITISQLTTQLVSQYVQDIPGRDGWKHTFDYRLNTSDPGARAVMAIRSRARDGVAEGEIYTSGSFEPTDYDRDIVWADGYFVRWPERLTP